MRAWRKRLREGVPPKCWFGVAQCSRPVLVYALQALELLALWVNTMDTDVLRLTLKL